MGLIWPITVAPYQIHLVALLGRGSPETLEAADHLYAELVSAGIEVLYDDREESPGVKFNDADLIGLPIRLTVSERSLKQGGVEYKRRDQAEKSILPRGETLARVKAEMDKLFTEISEKIVDVPYKD